MGIEKTKIIENFLLTKSEMLGNDKFEVVGADLQVTGLTLPECQDILIYLDRKNVVGIWVKTMIAGETVTDYQGNEVVEGVEDWVRYSKEPSYRLSKNPIRVSINQTRINSQSDKKDFEWQNNKIIFSNKKELAFRGNRAKIINELISNLDHDVKASSLKPFLGKYDTFSKWKSDLKRRTKFFQFFEIESYSDSYRLVRTNR